jgi:hypothetical protein
MYTNIVSLVKTLLETKPTEFIPVGSSLFDINEDTPSFQDGLYSYCYNCGAVNFLAQQPKFVLITSIDCKYCFEHYYQQSDSYVESPSFLQWITSGLSESAVADIQRSSNGLRGWLLNGTSLGKSFMSHYVKIPHEWDNIVSLLEDCFIVFHHLWVSKSTFDRYVAIVNFCKLRGSRIGFTQTLLYIIGDICGTQIAEYNSMPSYNFGENEILDRINKAESQFSSQADIEVETMFADMRSYLGCYDKMKETTMYKKLHKFFLYLIANDLLKGVNIDFHSLKFDKFEAAAVKRTHAPGIDMVHHMMDTVLFVLDRGAQYFRTGDIQSLALSGSSYEKWITSAMKLSRNSKFLSNPEPHGINLFSYQNELKDAIEKGDAIFRYTPGLEKSEKIFIQKTLADLKMIDAEFITKKSAQMPRKDPFAILVHGSSSICKSQLKQILFYHYGKVFNLPTTSDYMYTRCPTDEYWSGFNSTQWCIVMDDIAFLKPNGEVDPTLKEMLQVKNSVPYTPPQASLEDKGRTPVRAELLIGTTNTKHLNLHAYFACPFAIARRLSYVITAHVKPEFSKCNFMADSEKIPVTPEGNYMDIWTFEVSIPVPSTDEEVDNQQTRYEIVERFDSIHDMLAWYIRMAKKHEQSQIKALTADKTMCNVSVCHDCYRAKDFCLCSTIEPQSGECNENYDSEFRQEWKADSTPTQLNLDGLSKWTVCELFFYQRTIDGNQVDFDLIDFCFPWLKDFSLPCVWLYWSSAFFFSFMLSPLFFTILLCFILFHFLIKYFFFLMHIVCSRCLGFGWKLKLLKRVLSNREDMYRIIFRSLGNKFRDYKSSFSRKQLMKFTGYVASAGLLVILTKFFSNKQQKSQATKKANMAHQASVGVAPQPKEVEKPTFYYQDPYVLLPIDISSESKCMQKGIMEKNMLKNLAMFQFRKNTPEGVLCANNVALNICGNIWMCNKHAMQEECGILRVIFDPIEQNVSRNMMEISYNSKDYVIAEEYDLVFFQLRCLPPGRNMVNYFIKTQTPLKGCYEGLYYSVDKCGDRMTRTVNAIRACSHEHSGITYHGYGGKCKIPTIKGDCGSPLVAKIGDATVILGVHGFGTPKGDVIAIQIGQEEIKRIISVFGPQLQCGNVPISAPGFERKLVPLHHKSTLRFLTSGTATIMGSFSGYRPKLKSRVKKTFIHKLVTENGDYVDDFGAPDFSWRPWHLAITDMTKPNHCYFNSDIKICVDAFLGDILQELGDDIKQIEVYDLNTSLNGADGVTFVDKLNCSTSAGNPFKCSKKNFLQFDDNNKIIGMDKVISDRCDKILSCYSADTRFHAQFCGHGKDEATKNKKILAGKTRIFTGGEMAWAIVVRRFTLSHIRMIQNNPFLFESMPGIVAQSVEWSGLYEYLTEFGTDRIIAGDYGKFDKKMAAPFILGAFDILIGMSEAAGWNEDDIKILRGIAFDTAFPTIDFNGDLIEIQGNPSGHPLTVIINCLVNCLYMRYAYMLTTGKDVTQFKKDVRLATYGDDNIMGVSPSCPAFNHTAIAEAMKKIGVEYTMADKEAESVPYINISDASFLKRKFCWSERIGAWVAPLDEESIHKMLTNYVDTGVLAPQAHSVCVIETALREYFFYGEDVFNQKKEYFKFIVSKAGLEDWIKPSTFPDYNQMICDFWMRFGDKLRASKYSGITIN